MPEILTRIIRYLDFFAVFIGVRVTLWTSKTTALRQTDRISATNGNTAGTGGGISGKGGTSGFSGRSVPGTLMSGL